jgi:hypothetical protein
MVSAALVARSLGRGFSVFGTGGGRAAVCGEDAEGDRAGLAVVVGGMTTGGELGRSGVSADASLGCERRADVVSGCRGVVCGLR